VPLEPQEIDVLHRWCALLIAVSVFAVPGVLSAQPGGVKPTTRQHFPADPAASVPALSALVSARSS
jgi:hypothetical protein